MTLVFPRFRQCLFSLTNMADRESSSENNTRSRSVQDFVRTVLHAVTNLQTQSGNPNRATILSKSRESSFIIKTSSFTSEITSTSFGKASSILRAKVTRVLSFSRKRRLKNSAESYDAVFLALLHFLVAYSKT